MKVLFDLNVLLDLFLDRDPWVADAKSLVAQVLAQRIRGCVCATSITTLFYIARKSVGTDQAPLTVRRCVQAFEVVAVGGSTLAAASEMKGGDFEDSVQIAAAIESGADVIVTRDPKGFVTSPIRVASPAALAAELATALQNP